ncbi:hypothetical protein FA10DRAFT_290046 [Acaromyces ingoldii]|uniref:Concanavalin A-like lectin/glucanase n=1 Tax=Acaromyces ingoldii TaxID=215250 RepID=A0A316YUY4_9BASI|nr:hypothetical protein FA10DRAFT_290046 [Acaromyces ingoldii]PWN92922.1 hypothetical protein FA10DRAFT_290046 [Acaromyces ingoldii]
MSAPVAIYVFLLVIATLSLANHGLGPPETTFHGIGRKVKTEVFWLSGKVTVPKFLPPGSNVASVWPGLQKDGVGIMEGVTEKLRSLLQGRNPKTNKEPMWLIGGDYYKGKTFSQGTFMVDGNSVDPGQMVPFDLRYIREFHDWVVTVGSSDGNSVSFTYSPSQTFDYILFAVGLQIGASWDFGPVIFTDITIAAYDKDTLWCTQAWDQFGLTTKPGVVGAKPKVYSDHTECHIDSVTLYS